MKKKLLTALLCTVMVVLAAAGCGKDEAPVTREETSEQEETQDEEPDSSVEPGVTKDGIITYNIDMSQYEKGQTVRVWLPVAQTNEIQTIDDVKFDAGDAKTELTEDESGNKMLYIEWDADAEAEIRKASCSFHTSRHEITSPVLKEEGEIGADLDEYLTASSTIPLDGTVKAQADEITKGEDTYLGKARAIYDWIIANMDRDESVVGCGTGDVCTLLDTKGGKCTDINSVFIGLCRAAGIPAREMFGVRINDTDITKNQHCWTEFYVPGTGWVLADPADVLRAVLKNGWEKDSAEAKEMQEFYWGNSEAERVELSRSRDIILSPSQDGEPLNNFGYPYAEVNGEAVDYYDPDTFVYTISFAEDQ